MRDQSALEMGQMEKNKSIVCISSEDRKVLRELAKQLEEYSHHPKEDEKRKLWIAHNDLKETRPVIFCDPENGWSEIITEKMIVCSGDLAREWEMHLRKEICWASEMKDDKVIDAVFDVPYVATESDWGMCEIKIGGENGHAYRWEPPVKDYADIAKLKTPAITVDNGATQKMLSLAQEVFEPHLNVSLKHKWWWTLGMTWTLVNLRGMDQIMFDMYDEPEALHQVMCILRDGHLSKLDFLEKNGFLSSNNGNTYVGSGGFGFTGELKPATAEPALLKDMWGFAESQETIGISPDMFAEFVLPYQLPILEKFGLNCYGCCEPLNIRWKHIKKIPHLRRVSVSPWADVDVMAHELKGDYIYSYKPNPTYLAVSEMDRDFIRKGLRDIMKRTKDCRLEIIMKDNNTLGGNPKNAFEWCRIALEEAMSR